MKRLQILQVFSRYLQYGGEESSVFRMGDALQERHDVEYFINSSEQLTSGGLLRKSTVPLRVFYNHEVLKKLERYQQIAGFDCWFIHNVFPSISPGAYPMASRLGVPVIHYLHNYKFGCVNGFMFHHGRENRDGIKGNFWPAIRDKTWRDSRTQTAIMAAVLAYSRSKIKVFEKVARWVAISEAQKRIHVKMGIPEDRIDVVHHFLETSSEIPPAFPDKGLGVFVGRLSPEKGVDHLLRAWAELPRHRKLVIIGDGPEMRSLKELAAKLGLDQVVFTGFLTRDAQEKVWQEASFSIVPSVWQETFGMVVLEAWAKARPVVAHSIGALPEIIRDGHDGFLADPTDPGALAAALKKAFSPDTDLRGMGLNGYERLKQDFNKTKWLDRIDDVCRRAKLLPAGRTLDHRQGNRS